MSIASQTARVQYTLTSLGQTLAVAWYFLAAADLKVVKTDPTTFADTDLTLDTHYTASGAANPAGGSITLTSAAAAIGDIITIYRNGSLVQPATYPSGGQFPSATTEQSQDRLTMLAQQLKTELDRTLRVPVSNASVDALTKPNRAGKILAFDEDGDVNLIDADEAPLDGDSTIVTATGSTTARSLAARFAEVKNVKDFGAVGDGITDDSAAILAAVNAAAALTAGALGARSEVYFPAGVYLIGTSAALTPTNSTSQWGVKYRGAGMNASILRLNPSGSDIYFYNNGATARTNFATFEDLAFQGMDPDDFSVYSDISTNAKGFRLWATSASGSHEQGFRFNRCRFMYLGTALEVTGDETTSELSFIQCKFSHIRATVMNLENIQTFNHQFVATDIEVIYGDVFDIGSGAGGAGGGAIKVQGGSIILLSDSGAATYFMRMTSSASGINGNPIVFSDVRFELRGDTTNLVSCAAFMQCNPTFRSCYFLDTGDVDKTSWVTIGAYAKVQFEACVFFEQGTGLVNFLITTANNYGQNGTIEFVRCALQVDWSDRCTTSGAYGNHRAIGCYGASNVGAPADLIHYAHDFDLNGVSAAAGLVATWPESGASLRALGGYTDLSVNLKRAYLKLPSDYWNITTAPRENLLRLPKNAIIRNILWLKPEITGDANALTWNVGNSDKTTAHLTTASTANNVALKQVVSDLFYFVGDTDNERNLRMYVTAGTPSTTGQGGFVIVEYQ